MFHGSLIILMITHLNSLCFSSHTLDSADFTSITIDIGELIFSGETVEVTVCENTQLIFPLSLEIKKIELSIKCDVLKGHLQ
jgi:hypothetical protein